MALRVLFLCALWALVNGNSGGFIACSNIAGHGTSSATGNTISLRNVDTGAAVSSYTPGQRYTVALSGSFLGFTLKVLSSPYTQFSAAQVGSMAAGVATRTMSSCPGGLTHSRNTAPLSSATGVWTAPSAGTGSVVLYAVVVRTYNSYQLVSATMAFETVGAEGSAERSAFVTTLTADVERALALPSSSRRIIVGALSRGSVIASFFVEPPPAGVVTSGPAGSSVTALVAAFQSSVADTSSALYQGGVTSLADPTFSTVPSFSTLQKPDVYAHSADLSPELSLAWSVSGARLWMRLSKSSGGWAGVGFNTRASMVGGDAISVEPGQPPCCRVTQLALTSRDGSGVKAVQSSQLDGVTTTFAQSVGGPGWVAEFSRPLSAGSDPVSLSLSPSSPVTLIAAWGAASGMSYHSTKQSYMGDLDLASGSLTQRLSTSVVLVMHGLAMVLAWAVTAPAGVAIARFAKAWPGAKWFAYHRSIMSVSWVASLVGCGLGVALVSGPHFVSTHSLIGIAVVVVGFLQPLNAWTRPSKAPAGQPPTLLRSAWEWTHKGSGHAALVTAVVAVLTGLDRAGAHVGFSAAAGAWAVGAVVLATCLEVRRVRGVPLPTLGGGKAVLSSAPAGGKAVLSSAPAGVQQPVGPPASPPVSPTGGRVHKAGRVVPLGSRPLSTPK